MQLKVLKLSSDNNLTLEEQIALKIEQQAAYVKEIAHPECPPSRHDVYLTCYIQKEREILALRKEIRKQGI